MPGEFIEGFVIEGLSEIDTVNLGAQSAGQRADADMFFYLAFSDCHDLFSSGGGVVRL